MNLCINCKHHREHNTEWLPGHMCMIKSPIDGEMRHYDCEQARYHICKGEYFEHKNKA